DAHAARLVAMCALQAAICFASVMAWVALGVRLQRWLDDPRRRFVFNAAMAASLAACAVATLVAAFDHSAI
ncbi:MAG TPA: hypothetical protein VJ724_16055, partial [Tahibacter sp.]|nr:hypothetical protein [Tahibacter sp.]